MTPDKKSTISLLPILSVNFIGTLGFGIVLPFLIFLVTRYGGNALIYGILGATYSLFQLIGAPILGKWSDTFGRRKILFLSQIGTLLSWLIFFMAMYLPSHGILDVESQLVGNFTLTLPLIILFLARALDGLTGGNVSVANAYLADVTEENDRSANFGKMSISSNLGYVIGPALAGVLGATIWAEKLPVIAAILISLTASLIIYFKLPEKKSQPIAQDLPRTNVRKIIGQEQKECYKIECKKKISIWDVMNIKVIRLLLIVNFLVFLGFNFFYIAFPVYAVQTLEWDIAITGVFFSFLSIIMIFIQGPVLSYMAKRNSDIFLIIAGSLILAISFLFYLSQKTWIIYSGAVILAIGNGLMWPSVLSMISKSSPANFQGAIQGYTSSLGSTASIIGLLFGGIFFNLLGTHIFILAAIIIVIVFFIVVANRDVLQQ